MDELKNKTAKISNSDWVKIIVVLLAAAFALYRCFLPFRAEYAFREAYNYEAQAGAQSLSAEVREHALQKSIEKYIKTMRLAPWETYYHTNLGRIYENKARAAASPEEKLEWIKKAEDIYDFCLKISPTNPWYVMRKSEIYALYADLESNAEKKAALIDLREQKILEAGELDPNNAIFQLQVANLYLSKREFAKAEEKYQHVLVIDERMGDAYMMLSEMYRTQGDLEQQMEMYRLVIEKNPTYKNARLNLGILYEQQDKLKEAINLYKEEALLDKNNEYAFRVLGNACFRDGQWANMEVAFNRLTIINPSNADYYLYRAQAQVRLNKTTEAIKSLEAALTLRPDDATIRNNLNSLKGTN